MNSYINKNTQISDPTDNPPLPEYSEEELEQNAFTNLKNSVTRLDEMKRDGMTAEAIVDFIHSAVFSGYKTPRYPKPRVLEPWRVNEIGIK